MQQDEKKKLMQDLSEAGCSKVAAGRISELYEAGRMEEMLRLMKRQRCDLMDEMHESQRKVDRMDFLIRKQEKSMQ